MDPQRRRGGFFSGYLILHDVQAENQRMKRELGDLKLKNQFLTAELSTADRAKALLEFRSSTPSRTLPARVIGTGTGANSRVVFVDRGTSDGVKKGMAAITPEGIVGRVVAAYPTSSLVQLITEDGSVAGVISQKNRVRGILKGKGSNNCVVDYVQNEDKLGTGRVVLHLRSGSHLPARPASGSGEDGPRRPWRQGSHPHSQRSAKRTGRDADRDGWCPRTDS